VRPGSDAATAGLRAQDRVLAVNGAALRDAIDFQFHAADAVLRLDVEREGRRRPLTVIRAGSDLGVELTAPKPGDIATCANKCVFCFIHQLPKGMRKSLYVKDDDYRLSFLHGNYITLTDLDDADFDRIVTQRLSPLYVSVHATDPALRHRLLGDPRRSAEILPRLERLAKARIRVHAQIVLCPDLNDGAHLARTVAELAPLHPHVATTAIVPVGLTRHRQRLPSLRVLTVPEAAALVERVEEWQRAFMATLRSRFVFLADEVYLQADRPLPPAAAYRPRPELRRRVGALPRTPAHAAGAARRHARHGRDVRAAARATPRATGGQRAGAGDRGAQRLLRPRDRRDRVAHGHGHPAPPRGARRSRRRGARARGDRARRLRGGLAAAQSRNC
jgi:putative radical SAM enzyme (TIGR03279 family)